MKLNIKDIAASYQEAIIDCLNQGIMNVVNNYDIKQIYISGGVASNSRFRQKSKVLQAETNISIIFPKLEYCTDNAAMITMAAYHKIIKGEKSSFDLSPIPNLKL